MQVSSTLIAAQQAAREAQARFQAQHFPQARAPEAGFSAALEKTAGFSPLPLKQTAAPASAAPAPAQPPAGRLGSLLDIKV